MAACAASAPPQRSSSRSRCSVRLRRRPSASRTSSVSMCSSSSMVSGRRSGMPSSASRTFRGVFGLDSAGFFFGFSFPGFSFPGRSVTVTKP